MVALGFPNNGNGILKTMYQEVTLKVAESFIGNYTNTIDTIRIDYRNKEFSAYHSKFKLTNRLNIKDGSTLNFSGAYLEFSDDKSEFYLLMNANQPVFKRIPQND